MKNIKATTLKDLREQANLSFDSVREKLGVTADKLNKLEEGNCFDKSYEDYLIILRTAGQDLNSLFK